MTEVTFIPHVEIVNGDVRTTSLKVAEHFGKRHDTVLRSVRNLECSDDFRLRNFAECSRINELANGKREPYIEMTRDGFTFVAMGFTGKEAAKWKEAYISAFNRMEAELMASSRQNALKELPSSTLTFSEQQTLSEIVDRRSRECANIGKAKAEIWSRIHRKFRVAKYQQIDRTQLSDAIAYVMQMELKGKAPELQPPVPSMNRNYAYALEHISYLKDWSSQALQGRNREQFLDAMRELEGSLRSGWTEMDEALWHLAISMSLLRRWRDVN